MRKTLMAAAAVAAAASFSVLVASPAEAVGRGPVRGLKATLYTIDKGSCAYGFMQARSNVPSASSASHFIMVISDSSGSSLPGYKEKVFSRAGARHVDMGFCATRSLVKAVKAGKKVYGDVYAYRTADRYVGEAKDCVALVDRYDC